MNDLYVCLVIPIALFLFARFVMPNVRYEFDFSTNPASFTVLLVYFERMAARIFWFGTVGAFAFQHFIGGWGVPVILLGAAIYALLFNIWILTSYESYLQSRYRRDNTVGLSSYTVTRYAITLSLGTSSVILLILGVIMAMRSM